MKILKIFVWIFPRILKLLVQIAPMFSVKYFCSQQIVVEEEIQEVEVRFRRAQFTATVMHLTVCHTIEIMRKVRVFLWKGIRKSIISYYSSAFSINPQPRRRSVRSHKSVFLIHVSSLHVLLIQVSSLHVLLIHVLSLHFLLIHVLSIESTFYQSSPGYILSHAR